LLRTTGARFLFYLGNRDKQLLLQLLSLYPLVPAAHQRLSKTEAGPRRDEAQRLLDDALAEQRSENKRNLQTFLSAAGRFEPSGHGWRFAVSQAELEWLLQILNDVRVGSWIKLGSPEPKLEMQGLNEKTGPDFWAMEMAGVFQGILLEAAAGPPPA
jgi:hypothetical protein